MHFCFNEQPYIALIGDMKLSKALKAREEEQEKFKKALDVVNARYADDIASDFTITLGDEFQGLLLYGAHVMDIITKLERDMHPVEIRFGIGVGAITTSIDRSIAIGADGPAYYAARAAVEYLKENEKKNQTSQSDIRLEMDGDPQQSAMLLNTVLALLTTIKRAWTDKQREVIWMMLEQADSQTSAAEKLGIKKSSVQKMLARGNYYTYKEALATIGKVLGEIDRRGI